MMYQGGIKYMRYSVSDTAEYGDYTAGPQLIDDRVRATMRQLLGDIQSGEFAKEWIAENEQGRANFMRMRANARGHQLEEVGDQLRPMMTWLPKVTVPDA
jgi:ketol-acid reductoisomerase